jgi:hypothetical protein
MEVTMNKDKYGELDWFDQLQQDDYTRRAKKILKARYARRGNQLPLSIFQRLLGWFKSILGVFK